MSGKFILEYRSEDGKLEVSHKDGVSWFNAPLPPRFHKCWVQTEGITNWFTVVWRCPCGAILMDPGRSRVRHWVEKNSRRKK